MPAMKTPRFLPLTLVAALTAPTFAQDKAASIDFATKIWPILEKNCIECHQAPFVDENGRTKRPKGGVVFDSKDGILGSKKGTVVVAKKSADSLLYQSISLPADDEDRMPPPKKGGPLSKEQIELIQKWIDGGADFGKWTGKAEEKPKDKEKDAGKEKPSGDKGSSDKPSSGKPPEKKKGESPLVTLSRGLRPLAADVLAGFDKGPFQVTSIGDGSPLLRVGCAGNTDLVDDQAVLALLPLAEHVTELDLGRSRIGDPACAVIQKMTRLTHLDLRQTQVGNQGVAALGSLKELRSLNLFGTKAGDYAMAALAELKHLEQLYLWQTEVSASAAVRLREQIPGLRVVVAADLPDAMPAGAGQGGRRRN
jgi:hypothetical protein